MNKKLLALLLSLLAVVGLAAGCGDDDEDDAAADTSEETVGEDEEAMGSELAEGEIDPATLEAFVDAINEDPTIVCDPENATEAFLEMLGGEEACLEASAGEEGGQPYTIDETTIEGDTATVVITDDDSTDTVTFVQEGDELKIDSAS